MKDINFKTVVDWHEELMNNRSQRAILRRCKNLTEIQLQSAYVDLCQKLGRQGEKIALIAGVVAHVKENKHQSKIKFSRQLAVSKKGAVDAPRVSKIRFQRLLSLKNNEQLLRQLVRVVRQIDDFDMLEFSKDLFYWSDKTKKRWAYAYYSTPTANEEPAMSTTGENV